MRAAIPYIAELRNCTDSSVFRGVHLRMSDYTITQLNAGHTGLVEPLDLAGLRQDWNQIDWVGSPEPANRAIDVERVNIDRRIMEENDLALDVNNHMEANIHMADLTYW